MTDVDIRPLPSWARKLPGWLRPVHPPIFDDEPSEADRELASALIAELDDESKGWYRGHG